MAFLMAKNGPKAGKRYELMGEAKLGRHPDCQICIPEVGAVSRHHAKITVEAGQHYVEDLVSRNGTILNGDLLIPPTRQKLNHGDTLRICDVEFGFELELSVTSGPTTTQSGMTVLLDDQADGSESTIMSKVEISAGRGPLHVSASPETRLAAMMEITQALGKALSLDEVLAQILNSLFKIFMQADRGFIVLRREDGALVPRWTKVGRPNSEDTMRISRTIINKVIDSREAILSADASSDSQFNMSQSVADFCIRSMMCAPLVDSDGRAFGALQIDTLDQRSRFQKEDLELLASIASQAAIAIDNAQLHDNAIRQKTLERDLQLAIEVQRGFLPEKPLNLQGYSFFQYYQPANQVGGDYFDYIKLPDGKVAIVVADVVGHGVAAALMMAKLSAETRYCLGSEREPCNALTRLNEGISVLTQDRFVTMIILVIDPAGHEATIVNAGHMAPIWRHADGTIEEFGEETRGYPVGFVDGFEYEQTKVPILPGDLMLMYTDGINEVSNANGDLFGIDRIRNLVAGAQRVPALLGQQIIDDVRKFLAGRGQDDDMCLVCGGRIQDDVGFRATSPVVGSR
ncbi:MAG: GAF domain-containing protein [Planctomycetes bacterium]|nr:GAF domain-containing protein [Planctomycetota bacterium]